jgi:hypothetical protein
VTAQLKLDRAQILAFRRRVSALDSRLPMSPDSLRHAGWAGLQDSMPRAALLSIHARVRDTQPDTIYDESLLQVWGPRFSAYVVPAVDRAVFTLSRMPDDERGRQRAESAAQRLRAAIGDARAGHHDVGEQMGINPNSLRYGTATGEIAIRWEGARQPQIWMLPRPETSPEDARAEMARRYLHVFGPTSATRFADWAGISARAGHDTFVKLASELTQVLTPIGEAVILTADLETFSKPAGRPAQARLLPSGDTYFLLWGEDRELLLPDAASRAQLWTSRVWPGAVLVSGEIVGVWRRANEKVTVELWRPLSPAEREAVEEEASGLPLPGLTKDLSVSWVD